jgi:hypothetical protein
MNRLIAFIGVGSLLMGFAWTAMNGGGRGPGGVTSTTVSPAAVSSRGPRAGEGLSHAPRGPLQKAILLIPLTYNDGRRIPRGILEGIHQQLVAVSGGYTLAGTVTGAYRMSNGTQQPDVLEQVWVAYSAADRPRLRALAARFCALLEQESIYLEFTDSVIELTPPRIEGREAERGGTS